MKKQVTYSIPTTSDDIPLKVFQEIVLLDDDAEPLQIVSLITGVNSHHFSAMREKDVLKIYGMAEKALLDKNKPPKFDWEHEGVTYSLHPDMENMTLGEVTDLQTYFNDPANYHRAMAVCYRRRIKTHKALNLYDIEPYTGTKHTEEIFRNIPLSYFYGLRAFFLTIGDELNRISRLYSIRAGTQTAQRNK